MASHYCVRAQRSQDPTLAAVDEEAEKQEAKKKENLNVFSASLLLTSLPLHAVPRDR